METLVASDFVELLRSLAAAATDFLGRVGAVRLAVLFDALEGFVGRQMTFDLDGWATILDLERFLVRAAT